VLSSVNEPLSGWVDNWNGPTGIVSAVGKGIFHTIMCNEESIADFIPVDLVRAEKTTSIREFELT
jgi:alcohol-forming fatty acyl-CoA reductase